MGQFESRMANFIRDGLHLGVDATEMTIPAGTAVSLPATPLNERKCLALSNQSGATIYIGGTTVTGGSSKGYPVINTGEISLDVSDRATIYAYNSTASTLSGVYVLEIA